MKYKDREILKGEKVVIFSDRKSITAEYVRDEKVEITVPIFDYEGTEISGTDCWWMPVEEAERVKEEMNYDVRTLKFNEKRGTSKK